MLADCKRSQRRGFVSTFLVLAVMATLGLVGMLCARSLLRERRSVQQGAVDCQIELALVAAEQWLASGGAVSNGESVVLPLASESEGKESQSLRCEVLFSRASEKLEGVVTVKRNGILLGRRVVVFSRDEAKG